MVASFLVEPGLSSAWASVVVARELQSTGSIVVVPRFRCSEACGVLPDQGSNLCPLHWQADSYPLCHQGSPHMSLLRNSFCEQVRDLLCQGLAMFRMVRLYQMGSCAKSGVEQSPLLLNSPKIDSAVNMKKLKFGRVCYLSITDTVNISQTWQEFLWSWIRLSVRTGSPG